MTTGCKIILSEIPNDMALYMKSQEQTLAENKYFRVIYNWDSSINKIVFTGNIWEVVGKFRNYLLKNKDWDYDIFETCLRTFLEQCTDIVGEDEDEDEDNVIINGTREEFVRKACICVIDHLIDNDTLGLEEVQVNP